jgi:hypothetical protein
MAVRGVWATPAAREEFRPAELDSAVADYEVWGPQFVSGRGGVGFRYYEVSEGRVLLLAERRGLVTLMTLEEFGGEVRKLRDQQGEKDH